jgi:RNA polymerase sigma factor (sigma-70 family)
MAENDPALEKQSQEFGRLMEQVAAGSQEAARELYRRYGPYIRRVVRRKLDARLRPKFDSGDFEQDVWASFFAHDFQKEPFDRPEALVKLLVTLTCHKVTDAFRKRLVGQKYNVQREHSLDSSTVTREGELVAPDDTPSQAVADQDQWEHFFQRQTDRGQQMLELFRQGKTHCQIAQEVGMNEKTVRRLLYQLALRLRS